jgi:hypothetical protein
VRIRDTSGGTKTREDVLEFGVSNENMTRMSWSKSATFRNIKRILGFTNKLFDQLVCTKFASTQQVLS